MNTPGAHHTPARLASILQARPTEPDEHAKLLAESLPFVRAMHGQTVVIALLGQVAYNPSYRQAIAQDVALLALMGLRPVLVHGGAPQFQLAPSARPADLPQRAAIQIARAAMLEINVELVRLLSREGVHAVGVNGQDLRCTGSDATHIDQLDTEFVTLLQAREAVPVVMPLALDAEFNHLLLLPEQMGSLLAQHLGAHSFLMVGDEGLLPQSGIGDGLLGRGDLQTWLSSHEGAPAASEAHAALTALNQGVPTVHLVDGVKPGALVAELLTNEGSGTVICRRTSPQLLADTARYFHDCDSAVQPGFIAERKRVVRF